jgi:hypothetical protein
MHNHETMTMTAGSGITEMQLMWFIMTLMAAHHIWMWVNMRKKKCECKR